MRYDIRTGMVVPDEAPPQVPGWRVPGQTRYDYDLRIGDAERDAAMAQLREHFAAGRLTLDELTERIDGALTAKTQRQIDALMADLPRLRSPRLSGGGPAEPAEDMQDAGRYLVLLLLLFALAAWLLMMAWMYSHTGPYPGQLGPPK
jgi:Domain of unknown function (DUF1707)